MTARVMSEGVRAKRFWSKVDKSNGPDACWRWMGSTRASGYGRLERGNRTIRAHRMSWELANGPIPDGLFVLHRCDNRICVNPGHLFLGTLAENNSDRDAKGRGAAGERNGARLHPERLPVGERNGVAKLTAAKVQEIRALHDAGVRQVDIAARFNISRETARDIAKRRYWRHV